MCRSVQARLMQDGESKENGTETNNLNQSSRRLRAYAASELAKYSS